MQVRFDRSARFSRLVKVVCGVLFCMLCFSLLPKSTMAQESGIALFLPNISGGLGKEAKTMGPIDGFDDTSQEQIEAAMLVEASADLPEPPPVVDPQHPPADADFDADGVPNSADLCPRQPNPPVNGVQQDFCGPGLLTAIDHYVFLQSRIFLPTEGLDPALKNAQKRAHIHVLLHVIPNASGVVLTSQQRITLQKLGVSLLEYLPENSYFASVPRILAILQQIVALENVQGISALQSKDKVAPQVRVQGPTVGHNADGTMSFDVDFYDDVPQSEIEALLAAAHIPHSQNYDNNYRVTLPDWNSLRQLVIQDIVRYVDDLPDEPSNETQNAQALMNGPVVTNRLGLRGNGIVVSMTELDLAKPVDRPEVNHRIFLGNNPILEKESEEWHPQAISAIMIADESTFSTSAGLLPEAILSTYSVRGLTIKAQHYGVNQEAHDDFGAVVSNNSWAVDKCAKLGEYHKRGKFFDRAVHDVGIVVVHSSGNNRGPNGYLGGTNCQGQLHTLSLPAAKNDISVGNWDIITNSLYETSSAGPAADGRLKPDLVAPSEGIDTIGWDAEKLVSFEEPFGGTSAAAAVTSGVIGWMAESFKNHGMNLDTIMPARYKAILVQTAKDVGPKGPDYKHGYGMIQADRALRITEEWSKWGREGTINEFTTSISYTFEVDMPMTFYKATLAWDDEEGDYSSILALNNDLDLMLVGPNGKHYYPYDLLLPAGATSDNGSVPCESFDCRDRLNNVEQVMVNPDDDALLQEGTWTAIVTRRRLVSDQQSFSLVLTPPCPLEIDSSITLTSDIECEPNALEPTGVLIQKNGIDLNCDGHSIDGGDAGLLDFDGSYVGVRVMGNEDSVRQCEIHHFDVGIKVGDDAISPMTDTLRQNTISKVGNAAIELHGDHHKAQGNHISEMLLSSGKGILLEGDFATIRDNEFHTARTGGDLNSTAGILVRPPSADGAVTGNSFDGGWWYGIRLHAGENSTGSINDFLVDDNSFEGIEGIPIELNGAINRTTVSNNHVSVYGAGQPGINVVADDVTVPADCVIQGNNVEGDVDLHQVGIQLQGTSRSTVHDNSLLSLKSAILAQNATHSVITGNFVNSTVPGNGFITAVGISDTGAKFGTEITSNIIQYVAVAIVVLHPDQSSRAEVTDNTIEAAGIGIAVTGAVLPIISDNGFKGTVAGIALSSSEEATVSGNSLSMNGTGAGILVGFSNYSTVADNGINLPTTGIEITGTVEISVTGNRVSDPQKTGIVLAGDSAGQVTNNEIERSPLGIHYKSGSDAVISSNTVNSNPGGVGIRLGTGAAGCLPIVNNILVENNVLNGSAVDIDVLCDVGTHTLINN